MPDARTIVMALTLCVFGAACGPSTKDHPRNDVPEPAVAGALTDAPAGMVVALAGEPEGLAFDTETGLLAVAVRKPSSVVLVDPTTGTERSRTPISAAARHLALAGPGGPVLVPTEGDDRLYRMALPGGELVGDIQVGRQPHDAAVAREGVVFVGDELGDTVHMIAADGAVRVLPAPVQPGGVAASTDGSIVVVVGVRGRQVEAYSYTGNSLGRAKAGVGPTHVEAGSGRLFYVADTQGGAVLIYEADPSGIRQVGRVSTGGGAPYGLAVDVGRGRMFVTLTERNELRSFSIRGNSLSPDRTWRTVRQPNDVVVDQATGRVMVAGTGDGVLQLIDPQAESPR